MELTDEVIAEFAEQLIPEAFTTASTATRVEIQPRATAAWLGEWVGSCLIDAVAARDLAGDPLGGVVFVQRGDERWRWDLPHPIWPMEALVKRIRPELAAFAEPCVFVADLYDRLRQQAYAGLRGQDEPGWTVSWYAEERSRHRAQVMNGAAEIKGPTPPRPVRGRRRKSVERAAHRLLVGHPSRRRYRLG